MLDRTALGSADVTDDQLRGMVAQLLGRPSDDIAVLDCSVETVAYELPTITTAGRYWVRGHASTPQGIGRFSFFVKHVQSWGRSPLFATVPAHQRDYAEASVPWYTEPLIYRSDLADRLPDGLTMPRSYGVFDLDEKSAGIWLAEVPVDAAVWTAVRFRRAGHLLGRLATSARTAQLAQISGHPRVIRDYFDGRLSMAVLPMLRADELWQHPLVAGAFDAALRDRLLLAADRAEELVAELDAMPLVTGHGDACPNNMLVCDDHDGFVLIDYGFWGVLPIGFDLGQLLVGDIQVGRRTTTELTTLEPVVLAGYLDGMRAEGSDIPDATVRRAHALQLVVFTGLSAVPFEHLGEPPTPERHRIAAERAAIARFSLDLLDRTAG
jgi:hypothetical protein